MTALKDEIISGVNNFFNEEYRITTGTVVPNTVDIPFGNIGKEIEAAMLFIDIRESTKIVDGLRRTTAAKMYKSFLWGVSKIAISNNGELRSFNGDGVLVVFIGENKRTNSVKAALQMSWFAKNVLKPKLDNVFQNNQTLNNQSIEFNFGIGIDTGKILVIKGGIRGDNNNDLVWVGNATNYAVKLSDLSNGNYNVWISKNVYDEMNDSSKFGGDPRRDMWEPMNWTANNDIRIYRSNWTWSV